MKMIFFLLWNSLALMGYAQSYPEQIRQYRQQYKTDFLTDSHSPLGAADTGWLRFYAPDTAYRVLADLILTPRDPAFDILTHSGKKKRYRRYAIAQFRLQGKRYSLDIFQSLALIRQPEHRNSLFLPINDLTNYETTYGGGRYLDLSTADIHEQTLLIDFNKCYNPYCAFAGGYSCPIPPDANRLPIRVEAGEQNFAGTVKE